MIGAFAGGTVDHPARDATNDEEGEQHIMELQSNGTSSDDEAARDRGTDSRSKRKTSKLPATAETNFEKKSSVVNGFSGPQGLNSTLAASSWNITSALHSTRQRNQYHLKILDRLGYTMVSDPVQHMPVLGHQDTMSTTSSGDTRSLLSSPSTSEFLGASATIRDPDWRDYIHGVFSNFDDLGMQFMVDRRWKNANYAVSRINIACVVVSILSLCFETVYRFKSAVGPLFDNIERVCVAWLLIDFVVRAATTREPLRQFIFSLGCAVDILSILPVFIDFAVSPDVSGLAVIRVLRLVRTVKIIRNSHTQGIMELFRAMGKSVSALSLLFFLLVIALFVSSSIIYLLDQLEASFDESENRWIRNDGTVSPFQSIFHTVWFAMATLSTVGYGDDIPHGTAAQFASAALMICGVLVIAFPTVILSASFHDAYSERFLTLLRNNITDKQRESLLYGRSRATFAALTKRRSTAADGGAALPSFRSRMRSILQRHASGSEEPSTAPELPPPPSSASATSGGGAADMGSKKVSSSKWSRIRLISERRESEEREAADRTAGRAVEVVPPVVQTSETAATDDMPKSIQDLEKRFAPPELQAIKLLFVPFVAPNGAADSDNGGDDDDDRGVITTTKRQACNRRATITQGNSEAAALSEALDYEAASSVRKKSLLVPGSSTAAEVVTSDSDSDDKELTDDSENENKPANDSRRNTRQDSLEPDSPLSLSPTAVMVMKSRVNSRPLQKETHVLRRVERVMESMNMNVVQLKSQTINPRGVVKYPPKLKLQCVGGTTTVCAKVERCFPPGSCSVSFTIVLDDADYRALQQKLAVLTFGANHVRFVELAPVYKLQIGIQLVDMKRFRELSGTAGCKPSHHGRSRILEEQQANADFLATLLTESDQELLDSCYLTTTTFRNVQSATVDAVVMCPSDAAFCVFQRMLGYLKFTFAVQFQKPISAKVLHEHTDSVSLVATDAVRQTLQHVCVPAQRASSMPSSCGVQLAEPSPPPKNPLRSCNDHVAGGRFFSRSPALEDASPLHQPNPDALSAVQTFNNADEDDVFEMDVV